MNNSFKKLTTRVGAAMVLTDGGAYVLFDIAILLMMKWKSIPL